MLYFSKILLWVTLAHTKSAFAFGVYVLSYVTNTKWWLTKSLHFCFSPTLSMVVFLCEKQGTFLFGHNKFEALETPSKYWTFPLPVVSPGCGWYLPAYCNRYLGPFLAVTRPPNTTSRSRQQLPCIFSFHSSTSKNHQYCVLHMSIMFSIMSVQKFLLTILRFCSAFSFQNC